VGAETLLFWFSFDIRYRRRQLYQADNNSESNNRHSSHPELLGVCWRKSLAVCCCYQGISTTTHLIHYYPHYGFHLGKWAKGQKGWRNKSGFHETHSCHSGCQRRNSEAPSVLSPRLYYQDSLVFLIIVINSNTVTLWPGRLKIQDLTSQPVRHLRKLPTSDSFDIFQIGSSD